MKKPLQVLTTVTLILLPGCSDDENGPTGGDNTGCCVIRGDVDHSGVAPVDIADLVYLEDYISTGGPEPPCLEESDVDGDGEAATISDRAYLFNYMIGGPEPPPCP